MRLIHSTPTTLTHLLLYILLSSPTNSQISPSWNITNFQNLITFGDSYTDENRLNYVLQNNGTYPPPGIHFPESFATPGGGRTWPRYVVQYTGTTINNQWTPQLSLYNYAVSGAVCSNFITPRNLTISPTKKVLFPSVLEYEIPTYLTDLTNTTYFTHPPTSFNTLTALWIGTNDLGVNAFLTTSQAAGSTLSTFTTCTFQVFDALYSSGSRSFILLNTIPLDLTPLYANATLDGTTAANSIYWPTKPDNLTDIAERIREYTTSVNSIWQYQVPFQALVNSSRYPGSKWAIFDVYRLVQDVYANPGGYLNGTEGANVRGWIHNCTGMGCTSGVNGSEVGVGDGFLWYDQLHPSEQMDRVIARNFVEVVNGTSKYAMYYG